MEPPPKRRTPRLRPRLYDFTRRVVRLLLRLLTRVHAVSLENCPRRGPAIIVINHLSYLDSPLVFAMLPIRVQPLVAARFRHRFVGWLLAMTGPIYVKRGQPDRAALRAACRVLGAGGCLAVAIEGTRSWDGRLQEGKNGVAYLAAKSRALLVPAAVWGTERIGASLLRGRRPAVHLRLGSAIEPPPRTVDVSTLGRWTRTVMERIAAMLPERYLPEPVAAARETTGKGVDPRTVPTP